MFVFTTNMLLFYYMAIEIIDYNNNKDFWGKNYASCKKEARKIDHESVAIHVSFVDSRYYFHCNF